MYYGSEKQEALDTMKLIHRHRMEYTNSEENPVKNYILACERVYKNYMNKRIQESDNVEKSLHPILMPHSHQIDVDEPVRTKQDNQSIKSQTPEKTDYHIQNNNNGHLSVFQAKIYKESSTRQSENNSQASPTKEKSPKRIQEEILINDAQEGIPEDDTPVPEINTNFPNKQDEPENIKNDYDLPLSPIEEQLARNEESKESLQDPTLIKEAIAKAKTAEKAARNKKPVSKLPQKTEKSPSRNYESATASWNRRSKSKVATKPVQKHRGSIDQSQKYL